MVLVLMFGFLKYILIASVALAVSSTHFANCASGDQQPTGGDSSYFVYPMTTQYEGDTTCFEYQVYNMKTAPELDQLAIEFDTSAREFRDAKVDQTEPENPWGIFIVVGDRGSIPMKRGYVVNSGYVDGEKIEFKDMHAGDAASFKFCFKGNVGTKSTNIYFRDVDDGCTVTTITGPLFESRGGSHQL